MIRRSADPICALAFLIWLSGAMPLMAQVVEARARIDGMV